MQILLLEISKFPLFDKRLKANVIKDVQNAETG